MSGIDSLAGPSEVVIIADRQNACGLHSQLDLQAQAEHDPEAAFGAFTLDGSGPDSRR